MELLKREWGRRHWLPLLCRRNMRLPGIGPVVTFSFDDFPRSAYRVGGAILNGFRVRGTFYAAYSLVGTKACSGEDLFRLEDLHDLVAEGHELASHTLHHVSGREIPRTAFVKEVLEGRAALQSIHGLPVSDNFSYPFGAVTVATKKAVGTKMLSCRSSFRGVNGPIVDLSLLRANSLYGGIDQLSLVKKLLRRAQELSGWLIFYTHDVKDHPSRYGCTPALLEAAVKAALDSSIKVMTVNEVLAHAGKCQLNETKPLLSSTAAH
jgi:peptidoglycan/xylan/chitin deacetylase (PgdA/CDA1 family)